MLCGSGSGPLTSEKCLYPTSEFEFSVSSATQGAGDNQLVCMSFPLLTMVSFNQRSNWTHYSSWYQVWTIMMVSDHYSVSSNQAVGQDLLSCADFC